MTSIDASKATYNQPSEKFLSTGTSHTSPNASTSSTRTTEICINGNSYVNTPSPSSIASSSTMEHPLRYRSCGSRNANHGSSSSKRRFRHDRLFHHTHSLNRQYVVTMTGILFQMQKEIYRLRRRASRVEQTVAKHMQYAHPIIRIPRLTRAELSAASTRVEPPEDTEKIAEQNDDTIPLTASGTAEINASDKQSSPTVNGQQQENSPANDEQSPAKTKYCLLCKHDYSTRSAYLNHMRNIHQEKFPKLLRRANRIADDNFNNQATRLPSDQSVLFSDGESDLATHFLVNPWDLGEGRLRPRRLSKVSNGPSHKVQCDVCHKFYHGTYIKKHKQNKHEKHLLSSPSEINEPADQGEFIIEQQAYETISNPDECAMHESNDPPSGLTIAEMEFDDEPITFPTETSKPIVFATTCLERYQLDIVDQFLQKFPTRVSRTSAINAATTHLVINDDKHPLRSPLTLKLVEAIAHHCYCVSYRWLVECVRFDRIVEESSFEIEGDNIEFNPHGGPQRARLSDLQQPLFHNICFMIKCTENAESNITNDHLRSLIERCGGDIINCVTKRLLDTHSIVVLCDQAYVSERRHNYDQCHSLGIHFVSSQWVIQSIVEYRPKLFSAYEETPCQ